MFAPMGRRLRGGIGGIDIEGMKAGIGKLKPEDIFPKPTQSELGKRMAETFRTALTDTIVRGQSIWTSLTTAFRASIADALTSKIIDPLTSRIADALTKGMDFKGMKFDGLKKAGQEVAEWFKGAIKEGGALAAYDMGMAIGQVVGMLTGKRPRTLGGFLQAGLSYAGAEGWVAPWVPIAAAASDIFRGPEGEPGRSVTVEQWNYFSHEGDPVHAGYAVGREVDRLRR